MVPQYSGGSKLRTFLEPFQDKIAHYDDIYVKFHKADVLKKYCIYAVNCHSFAFSTPHLVELRHFYIKEEISQAWISAQFVHKNL